MDKDIMKYLTMFKLRFGNESTNTEAIEFKKLVFPARGYRTDMVNGLIKYLCTSDVELLVRKGGAVRLTARAIKVIEENRNGI